MALVDYSAHFWGEKYIGYNVLYENMKKGEEALQELQNFLKERINMEDDILKCLGKSLNRANTHLSNNGSFVGIWRLTKGTLELWTEIQTTMLRNLSELSKDLTRYQDELFKIRKRTKDVDTLEAINLMQTTTTCLQKAKETYNQRCSEVSSLLQLKSNSKDWNASTTKEYLKVKHKLNKAHDEYRQYMEKYVQIRDNYEERIMQAARSFQEHDKTHLVQMKRFFLQMAKYLEDGHNAQAQISVDLRQNMEHVDIDEIMLNFVEEKGTGMELPQKIIWTEADELPPDFDITGIQSQSSSNSSAIVCSSAAPNQPTINDLLSLDDTWISAGTNTFFGSSSKSTINQITSENCSRAGGIFDPKSGGDSDSERHSEIGQNSSLGTSQSVNTSSISNVPQQISSWLGRQKLPHWRLKKHSASQSSLPTTTENIENPTGNSNSEFSKSYGEVKGNSFLKRYQKRGIKSSTGDLTQITPMNVSQPIFDGENSTHKVSDPLLVFGPPPPLPSTGPPPLIDMSNSLVNTEITISDNSPPPLDHSPSFSMADCPHPHWSTDSSTSDGEESNAEFQTSKIRQIQIKPLNESQSSKLNVSLDELRSAIGQIALQKSSTFENDPWSAGTEAGFSQSHGPIRPALTGDAHFHRKLIDGPHEFLNSTSVFSTAGTIARARPRSHTPLTLGSTQQFTASSTFNQPDQISPMPPNSTALMRPLGQSANSAGSPFTTQPIMDSTDKVPVAMAINEYLHVWIKSDNSTRPEIRVFGTVLLSLPISALPILKNMVDNSPLKFMVKGASNIESLIPNQLFGLSTYPQLVNKDVYHFSIERKKLCKFLQEQREASPQASFHNADLLHYKYGEKLNLTSLPLSLKSWWKKLDDGQTEIRIEYTMDGEELDKGILQNVIFTTKFADPNIHHFSLHQSQPQAKLDTNGNIVWEFAQLSKDKTPSGTLMGMLKHDSGLAIVPTNTYVQFQMADASISGAEIQLENDHNYTLSVFRRKVISGKYFCDPKSTKLAA